MKKLASIPVIFIISTYAYSVFQNFKLLDLSFNFREPSVAHAPEDIVGLGFFFNWIIYFILFIFSLFISFLYNKKKLVYFWIALFFIISLLDYFIFERISAAFDLSSVPVITGKARG